MKAKAIAAEAVTGISAIRNALQQYYLANGSYPAYMLSGVSQDGPAAFPGLSLRTPANPTVYTAATDGNPSSLDGTYFSEECYGYDSSNGSNGPVPNGIYCYANGYSLGSNKAIKSADAIASLDNPNNNGFIYWDFNTKTFRQSQWSKSGYPS